MAGGTAHLGIFQQPVLGRQRVNTDGEREHASFPGRLLPEAPRPCWLHSALPDQLVWIPVMLLDTSYEAHTPFGPRMIP